MKHFLTSVVGTQVGLRLRRTEGSELGYIEGRSKCLSSHYRKSRKRVTEAEGIGKKGKRCNFLDIEKGMQEDSRHIRNVLGPRTAMVPWNENKAGS